VDFIQSTRTKSDPRHIFACTIHPLAQQIHRIPDLRRISVTFCNDHVRHPISTGL
jgi:hypothetical protein